MKITFSCTEIGQSEIFDPPIPAKDVLPDWYKRQHSVLSEGMNEYGRIDETIKRCMPVLDAMTAGYILHTQTDIQFGWNEDGGRHSRWSVEDFKAIESHSRAQISELYIPDEFDEEPLKLLNPWLIKTPPGYSCLFITPMWRTDLPYWVCPGLVDTDQYPQPINFPFLLRRDFAGILPNGTPFVQIIPFKRDEWESVVSPEVDLGAIREWKRSTRHANHRYKRWWRTIKSWR